MKLKNSEFKNHSTLIKLYFLKHRIYKNNISKIPFQNSLNFFEVKLKQVLNLIHLYHFENKKILFIGFPYIKKKTTF